MRPQILAFPIYLLLTVPALASTDDVIKQKVVNGSDIPLVLDSKGCLWNLHEDSKGMHIKRVSSSNGTHICDNSNIDNSSINKPSGMTEEERVAMMAKMIQKIESQNKYLSADEFINDVKASIEKSWGSYEEPNNALHALVKIQLLPDGRLAGARIIKSSGDANFDKRGIDAVNNAAPFESYGKLSSIDKSRLKEFNLNF